MHREENGPLKYFGFTFFGTSILIFSHFKTPKFGLKTSLYSSKILFKPICVFIKILCQSMCKTFNKLCPNKIDWLTFITVHKWSSFCPWYASVVWIYPRDLINSPAFVRIFEVDDTKLTADLHFTRFPHWLVELMFLYLFQRLLNKN